MENSPITLISPFSYKLTLSKVANSIISTFQSLNSQKSFTCKVKNMTSSDLKFLSHHNLPFLLRQFQINLCLKSISFNPGLKGGGNCPLCLPAFKKFRNNALNHSSNEEINKSNQELEKLKISIENLTITEEKLESFDKFHPLILQNTFEVFKFLSQSLLSKKIRSHPLMSRIRQKLATLAKNYFVFSRLRNERDLNPFIEDFKNLKLELEKKNSIEEIQTIRQIDTLLQINNRNFWKDIFEKCETLVELVAGNKVDNQERENCESILHELSHESFISTFFEFYDKGYMDGAREGRSKFIKKFLNEYVESVNITEDDQLIINPADIHNKLDVFISYVAGLIERKKISHEILIELTNNMRKIPGLSENLFISKIIFFMRFLKEFWNEMTEEASKYLDEIEGNFQVASPRFLISYLQVHNCDNNFRENFNQFNSLSQINYKIIQENNKIEQIFEYFRRNYRRSTDNIFFIHGDSSIGKTTLSLLYSKKYKSEYSTIIYIDCFEKKRIETQFNSVASNIEFEDYQNFEFNDNKPILKMSILKILIIIDNFTEESDYKQLHVSNSNIHYIVISRENLISTSQIDYNSEGMMKLFCIYLNDFSLENKGNKENIIKKLKYSPYAIKLAASCICNLSISLDDYNSKLDESLHFESFTSNAFKSLYEEIKRCNQLELLEIISCFNYKNIPINMLQIILKSKNNLSDFTGSLALLMRTLLIEKAESSTNSYVSIDKLFSLHVFTKLSIETINIVLHKLINELEDNDFKLYKKYDIATTLIHHAYHFIKKIESNQNFQNNSQTFYLSLKLSILINKYLYIFTSQLYFDYGELIEKIKDIENIDYVEEFELKLNLGTLLLSLNLFKEAELILLDCLGILENNENLELHTFKLRTYLGYLYNQYGNKFQSLKYLMEAKDYKDNHRINDQLMLAIYYIYFAEYLIDFGDINEAKLSLDESIKCDYNEIILIRYYRNYAEIKRKEFKFDEALEYCENSKRVLQSFPFQYKMETFHNSIHQSLILFSSRNFEESKKNLEESCKIMVSIYDPSSLLISKIFYQ